MAQLKINRNLSLPIKTIDKTFVKKRILLVDSERQNIEHYYNSFQLLNKYPNYTVDRDGKIYEHLDSNYSANYYKGYNNSINQQSIIIALNNCGGLVFDNNTDKYKNWINEIIEEEEGVELKWRRFTYWENYKTKQLIALRKLIKHLCEIHGIEFKSPYMDNMTYDDALEYTAVISESNIYRTSCQINPTFDWSFIFQIPMV